MNLGGETPSKHPQDQKTQNSQHKLTQPIFGHFVEVHAKLDRTYGQRVAQMSPDKILTRWKTSCKACFVEPTQACFRLSREH